MITVVEWKEIAKIRDKIIHFLPSRANVVYCVIPNVSIYVIPNICEGSYSLSSKDSLSLHFLGMTESVSIPRNDIRSIISNIPFCYPE